MRIIWLAGRVCVIELTYTDEMKRINVISNKRTETRAGFPGSDPAADSLKKIHCRTVIGFTIVEAILSAFIISLAVIGPLSAARQGLSASSDSRDYAESIYLAEEAMEYIRNIRNENLLKGLINNNWLQGLGQCMSNNYCGISPISNNPIVPCGNENNNCELAVNSGVYSHNPTGGGSDWVPSGITRKVQIFEKTNNVDAEIIVTIERKKVGFPARTYVWKSILMNWMRTPS